ncbi:MAG: 1-acyl-sn-glycerol-3-phosphate acyltransferase [Thermoleophilia bacterium]|nr:1-acyl-sn-glycerol-3-phosphate acyltransferase [Thermoleophilia bacterium]
MRISHLPASHWAQHDSRAPQRLIRWIFAKPGRWFMRYRGYGHQPRVPETGGFLLAPAPHGAFVDPFIYGLGQPRMQLRFMAKYQALEWPIAGRLIKWGGGFPVYRGGDRSKAALEVARVVVESGDGLVVFMEGKLVLEHDGLGTPRNGLARLALATGAPVVPAASWGSKRAEAYGKRWWTHRPRITAVWGEPLQFAREEAPTEERVGEVREEIWAKVTECFEQAKTIAHLPGGRPPSGLTVEEALAHGS